MKIKKFKIKEKEDELIINFIDDNKESTQKDFDLRVDGISITLRTAINDMRKYLLMICEYGIDRELNTTIYGCTFTHKQGVLGCVISGGITLNTGTGVINLNTPHRISDFYSADGDSGQLMPNGMYDVCCALMKELKLYLGGNRVKQSDLFEEVVAEDEMKQVVLERLKNPDKYGYYDMARYIPLIEGNIGLNINELTELYRIVLKGKPQELQNVN